MTSQLKPGHGLRRILTDCLVSLGLAAAISAQAATPQFKVIAFYTGKDDQAHVSFVQEAKTWLRQAAATNHFAFDSTTHWNELNAEVLSRYQVVLFLDTRPDAPTQREAFQQYMEHGGAWMGFHFAAFALTFTNAVQNRLILDGLLWLGGARQ